jgi:hypothetical protein
MNTVTENAAAADVANVTVDSTCGTDGKLTPVNPGGLAVSSVSAITTTGFTINFTSTSDLTIAGLPTTVTLTPTTGTAVTGTITYNNTAKTATVTAALTAGTTYTASVAGLNLGTNNTITVPASTQLAVSSVDVLNAQQLKVTFSKEVTSASAQTIGNYKLDGVAISAGTAKLLDDNKTVIITLNVAKNQNTAQTFSIDANLIQDKAAGVYAPAYSKAVTFVDITAPTVQSVDVTGNKTVKVTFSEAVNATNAAKAANYKIDGQSLSAFGGNLTAVTGFIGTNALTNQVTLTFDTALTAGSHTLTVAASTVSGDAITDPASFTLSKVDNAFTVNSVSTEPTVSSITAQTSGVVKVVFSQAIDSTTLASAFSVDGVSYVTGTLDATDATNHTVIVTFGSTAVQTGANVLTIKKNVVADIYGNKVAPTDNGRVSFSATKDTVAPTVVSVYPVSETQFRVNFSEPVNTAYLASANFVLKDASGKVVYGGTGTAWDSVSAGSDNSIALLNLTATHAKILGSAQYTLAISNVADPAGNIITATSNTFTTLDKTAPELAATSNLLINTVNKTATVYFDEPMDTTSIGTLSNYLYAPTGSGFVAIPDGSTIVVAADAKSATITFPSTIDMSAWNGSAKLRVVGVKDAVSNVISGGSVDTIAAALSSSANNPGVVSSSATISGDSTKLTLVFGTDQQLSAVNKTDFTLAKLGIVSGDLKGGAALADIPVSATISGKAVTLTFTNADDMATLAAKGNGLALATGTYSNATNSEGASLSVTTALAVKDQITPQLVSESAVNTSSAANDSVTLTFNENIDATTIGLSKGDFTYLNTTTGTMLPVKSITASGKTLTVTFDTTQVADPIATSNTITIKPGSTSLNVADLAGNKYVPTSTDLAGVTTGAVAGVSFTSSTSTSTADNVSTLGLTGTLAASDNTSVATATIAGSNIAVVSVSAGTANVTVTASGHTATIPVTVAADGTISYGTIVKYTPAAPTGITLTSGATAGTTKLNTVTNAMEYAVNTVTTYSAIAGTTQDVAANAGDVIHVRYAVGTYGASSTQDITVGLSDLTAAIAPSISSVAATTTTGSTKLTGLTNSVVYEYVLDTNATLAGNAAAWSSAITLTAAGTSQDEIVAGTNTKFHIRIKATSSQPASLVCDGVVTPK